MQRWLFWLTVVEKRPGTLCARYPVIAYYNAPGNYPSTLCHKPTAAIYQSDTPKITVIRRSHHSSLSRSVAHDPYDNPDRDNPGQLKIDFLAPHRLPPVHRWQVYCHSILLGRTVLMYTCSRKKFTTLTCYNSDTHGQILIIFGRSVTEKDCDVSSYWLLDVA